VRGAVIFLIVTMAGWLAGCYRSPPPAECVLALKESQRTDAQAADEREWRKLNWLFNWIMNVLPCVWRIPERVEPSDAHIFLGFG
jgi:hypothetical protein